jgi:hypothetical protein
MNPEHHFLLLLRKLSARSARLMVLLLWLVAPESYIRGEESAPQDPNRVKAAFLRNFAHYVQWPESAFDDTHSPWRIAILGNATFCEVVKKSLKDRTEQERDFEVYCADSLGKLPLCQIVFFGFKEADKRRAVLAALKDKPVLTVAEGAETLREGGIIRFQLGDRVQMSVNLDQARAVSLKIQTKMLEVSTEVLENNVIRKIR